MSATQTPPPEAPQPPAAPERRCRRCGSTLGPDQDWCLACGAAATTKVAGPRGWRVPLFVGAALLILAIAAAVLAIVELSRGPERVAQAPAASPTPTPATLTPTPSATTLPEAEGTPQPGATATPSPGESATPSPGATATPSPGGTATPSPGATPSPSGGSFADWPAGRSAWTVVLESAKTRAGAERVAGSLQSKGDTVGILHSDDFSSLNKGYWVVFSGQYDSRKAAEDAMSSLPAPRSGAYVRRVSAD